MTSITSSTVTMPTSLFSSSTTGTASRLYDATCRATSSWSVSTRTLDDFGRHDPLERRFGRHQQQPAQRCHAHQVPARIDDVEVEHHLDVARALQRRDRFADRQVFAQREHLRVHDAARRLLAVFEQAFDLARFAAAHQLQDLGRQLLRQVIDQRRRVIRWNFLQQLGNFFSGSPGQQLGALFGAHFADGFHGQPAAALHEERKHGLALGVEERAEHLREVRGMLLLKQVQQVGGGADAEKPLDGVEYDVNSALRSHDDQRNFSTRDR